MPPISEADPAAAPSKATFNAKGRWQKGTSGNPAGYKKGSRHRATLLAEALLNGEADALIRKLIEAAKDGDPACLKICADKLLPNAKSRPVRLSLPVLSSVSDAQAALAAIVAGTAAGTILSDEAATLASIVSSFVKAIEVAELESRLVALEQANAEKRPGVHFNA